MTRTGAFQLTEPIPELRDPCAFAILRPWIDVNNVGTLVLKDMERRLRAREIARFAAPGRFFDFTRYRPTLHLEGGIQQVSVPNVTVSCARREGEQDFVFLHLLEPHASSEVYVDSVLKLLERLKVRKYVLLGSMYDVVPHTRPLIVTSRATGAGAQQDVRRAGTLRSNYQGPTSIVVLVSQKAPERGIETVSFIVSLPQYVALEEDYVGKVRLMEILNLLYNVPLGRKDFKKALDQRRSVYQRVEETPELKSLIPQLEAIYEDRIKSGKGEETPEITSEIEELLWEMTGKDVGKA